MCLPEGDDVFFLETKFILFQKTRSKSLVLKVSSSFWLLPTELSGSSVSSKSGWSVRHTSLDLVNMLETSVRLFSVGWKSHICCFSFSWQQKVELHRLYKGVLVFWLLSSYRKNSVVESWNSFLSTPRSDAGFPSLADVFGIVNVLEPSVRLFSVGWKSHI